MINPSKGLIVKERKAIFKARKEMKRGVQLKSVHNLFIKESFVFPSERTITLE